MCVYICIYINHNTEILLDNANTIIQGRRMRVNYIQLHNSKELPFLFASFIFIAFVNVAGSDI